MKRLAPLTLLLSLWLLAFSAITPAQAALTVTLSAELKNAKYHKPTTWTRHGR